MILYFAGESPVDNAVLVECGVKNLLKSYFYLKNNPKYTEDLMAKFHVFIDSGAFSAMTKKVSVNLEAYCQFLIKYKPSVYAGLDVIGNPAKTKENMAYMEEKGLRPIPTFHRGSSWDYLYEMLDRYDYIACGGIAVMGLSSKQRHMWLDRVWNKIAKRRRDIKVHGFGCSGEQIMVQYPWYSVDSTSWLAPVVYGREIEGKTVSEMSHEAARNGLTEAYWDKGVQRKVVLAKSIKIYLDLENKISNSHETHKFENLSQEDLFE